MSEPPSSLGGRHWSWQAFLVMLNGVRGPSGGDGTSESNSEKIKGLIYKNIKLY